VVVTWAIEEKGYSQRRACALIGNAPKTYRYVSARGDDRQLRESCVGLLANGGGLAIGGCTFCCGARVSR
jgi:hypothetical protein